MGVLRRGVVYIIAAFLVGLVLAVLFFSSESIFISPLSSPGGFTSIASIGFGCVFEDCHCQSDFDCGTSYCTAGYAAVNPTCVNGFCESIIDQCDFEDTCIDECIIDYGEDCRFDAELNAFCSPAGQFDCCTGNDDGFGGSQRHCVSDPADLPEDFPNREDYITPYDGSQRGPANCVFFPPGYDPRDFPIG